MGPARLSAFLTGLAALAAACCTPAAAKAARCDAKSAVATSIEAVQADFAAWGGKCVKLGGIGFGWKLYADRLAVAEAPLSSWASGPRAIAIKRDSGLPRNRTAQRIEVIGTVGSCAADNEVAESDRTRGDLFLVLGYCHASQGNYIDPTSIRVIDKAPVVRLAQAEIASEAQPLIAAPADMPGLGESQAIARRMLQALQAGDEDSFVRLADPDLIEDLDKKGLKPDWLRERLREYHEDYVPARQLVRAQGATLTADAPLATFIERSDLPVTSTYPALVHCWCKSGDCAGRWPVVPFDADNLRARPYLCIATNEYLLGPGKPVVQARVPVATGGFAEAAGN